MSITIKSPARTKVYFSTLLYNHLFKLDDHSSVYIKLYQTVYGDTEDERYNAMNLEDSEFIYLEHNHEVTPLKGTLSVEYK